MLHKTIRYFVSLQHSVFSHILCWIYSMFQQILKLLFSGWVYGEGVSVQVGQEVTDMIGWRMEQDFVQWGRSVIMKKGWSERDETRLCLGHDWSFAGAMLLWWLLLCCGDSLHVGKDFSSVEVDTMFGLYRVSGYRWSLVLQSGLSHVSGNSILDVMTSLVDVNLTTEARDLVYAGFLCLASTMILV